MKRLTALFLVCLTGCGVFHKQPQHLTAIPYVAPFRLLVTATTPTVPTRKALAMSMNPSVTLAWDESNDPSVVGYGIYWGVISRNYTNTVMVTPATNTSVTLGPLAYATTYYFAATAFNTNLLESTYSSETTWTVAPPPTNIVIIIQMQAATDINGPYTNYGSAIYLTNPPAPQMFFQLQIGSTNF